MDHRRLRITVLSFIWGILFPLSLTAHPHVFMDCRTELLWENSRPARCRIEWVFDRFFSSDIIRGFDRDGDGRFDEKEKEAVYNGAFINLKNYGYFTLIRAQGKTFRPETVSGFTASHSGGRLTYSFTVDIPEEAALPFSIAVYDVTFFCSIEYDADRPILFRNVPAGQKVSYRVVQTKENPVYYNPMGAVNDNAVYNEWKPGLETFYPIEIEVSAR